MKFVTGGCYQGKQQWVLTHEKLLQSQIADGAVCSAKEIKDAKALDHFHLLVQRWMLADKNPSEEIELVLRSNPGLIIITDEIGGGSYGSKGTGMAGGSRQSLLSPGQKGRLCYPCDRRHRAAD